MGKKGILKPAAIIDDTQYFAQAEVDRIIRVEEAAQLLGIGVPAVRSWIKNGRLKIISGPPIGDRAYDLLDRLEVTIVDNTYF